MKFTKLTHTSCTQIEVSTIRKNCQVNLIELTGHKNCYGCNFIEIGYTGVFMGALYGKRALDVALFEIAQSNNIYNNNFELKVEGIDMSIEIVNREPNEGTVFLWDLNEANLKERVIMAGSKCVIFNYFIGSRHMYKIGNKRTS